MARPRWTGTTDGNYTDDTNWVGITPIAGDTQIWDGSSSVAVDINQAALTALTFADTIVEADYGGDLGNSGTPMEFSSTRLTYKGSGTMYFNNGSTGTTPDLFVDTPSGSIVLGDNSSGGGITRISLLACRNATLTSTLDSTTDLFINSGVTAVIQGSNTITNVWLAAGARATCTAAITNLYNGGGTWTQLKGGAAVANMYLMSPTAVVNYFATAQITLAVLFPMATLELRNGPQPKDVVTAWVFPSGRLGRIDSSIPTNGGSLRSVVNLG